MTLHAAIVMAALYAVKHFPWTEARQRAYGRYPAVFPSPATAAHSALARNERNLLPLRAEGQKRYEAGYRGTDRYGPPKKQE